MAYAMSEPRWLDGDDFALDEDEACEECDESGEECECNEEDPDIWHDQQFED
jgi:hypothetical protein